LTTKGRRIRLRPTDTSAPGFSIPDLGRIGFPAFLPGEVTCHAGAAFFREVKMNRREALKTCALGVLGLVAPWAKTSIAAPFLYSGTSSATYTPPRMEMYPEQMSHLHDADLYHLNMGLRRQSSFILDNLGIRCTPEEWKATKPGEWPAGHGR